MPLEGIVPSTGTEGPREGGEPSTETGGYLIVLYPVQELEVYSFMTEPPQGVLNRQRTGVLVIFSHFIKSVKSHLN